MATARPLHLANGLTIRVVSAPAFVATKLEAGSMTGSSQVMAMEGCWQACLQLNGNLLQ